MSESHELSDEEARGPCGDTCHRWGYARPLRWRPNLCQVLAECLNCHNTYWLRLPPESWQKFLLYLGASKGKGKNKNKSH